VITDFLEMSFDQDSVFKLVVGMTVVTLLVQMNTWAGDVLVVNFWSEPFWRTGGRRAAGGGVDTYLFFGVRSASLRKRLFD
jgi:hypothetical protein